jgi:pyrroloquinoline quinone biosynthesis protein D
MTAASIPDGTVPRLPHGVRFREDKARGQHILVGPERIFNADEVATQILLRIDGKASFGEIVEGLTQVFAADRDTIRPDVESFLLDLAEKQMVAL